MDSFFVWSFWMLALVVVAAAGVAGATVWVRHGLRSQRRHGSAQVLKELRDTLRSSAFAAPVKVVPDVSA